LQWVRSKWDVFLYGRLQFLVASLSHNAGTPPAVGCFKLQIIILQLQLERSTVRAEGLVHQHNVITSYFKHSEQQVSPLQSLTDLRLTTTSGAASATAGKLGLELKPAGSTSAQVKVRVDCHLL